MQGPKERHVNEPFIQALDGHRERRRRNQLVLDKAASFAKTKGAPGKLAVRIQSLDGHRERRRQNQLVLDRAASCARSTR